MPVTKLPKLSRHTVPPSTVPKPRRAHHLVGGGSSQNPRWWISTPSRAVCPSRQEAKSQVGEHPDR